jgi:AcrR family transcriptional regulator
MPRTSGRAALVEAAARLFAEQGFEATSVAEIQAAAGLAPGSGALYKHFASKQALLDAVRAERPAPGLGEGEEPGRALERLGRHLLQAGALGADTEAVAAFLRGAVRAGTLRDHDCEAVAALLIGALAHRRPIGERHEERLLAAWVDLALTALDPRRDLLDEVGPEP